MTVESVVVLNDFCHVQGGASRVAIDEAVALRGRGLNVTFLGAVGPVDAALPAAGVKTICLEQPELAGVGRSPMVAAQAVWNRSGYRIARSVLATLDRKRTIVHLHGYTKALSTTPMLAARRLGYPAVCTLHDFFAACPNGAFFNYPRQTPCTLRALSAACALSACDKRHAAHKAYRFVRGVAQRHIAGFPASVSDYIVLSERSAGLLRPYLPPDARLHALANIIDVAQAPPVDVGANDAWVVVGRLDAEKGVALASAAAKVAGVPIVFVGDGPGRAAAEAAGGTVTGWLPAVEVQRQIRRARCLVFPSLWYETFGLVVDEAAAQGVPAVVSDVSAPAERIADGRTGWLFPSGDARALARIMTLTRDTEVVRAAGREAYEQYWSHPSDPGRHVAELTAIYEAAISRSSRGG